jgi:hypothetical protein
LADAHSTQWFTQLRDPQILINKAAQSQLAVQAHALGQDSASLIESARVSLVSAIHIGQMLSVVVAIVALWQVRRLPHVNLRRKTERPSA